MSGQRIRTSLDEVLQEVREDEHETTGTADVSFTPSLDSLNQDQYDWLQRWIVEGYDSRRELVLSLHQMQFWALGRVPDGWFVNVCSHPVPLSVAITSENRQQWRDDPVGPATANGNGNISRRSTSVQHSGQRIERSGLMHNSTPTNPSVSRTPTRQSSSPCGQHWTNCIENRALCSSRCWTDSRT